MLCDRAAAIEASSQRKKKKLCAAFSAGGGQRLEDLLGDVSKPYENMLSMQEEKGNSDHATLDGGFADLFSQQHQYVPVEITSLQGAIRILECPAASSTQTSTLLKR